MLQSAQERSTGHSGVCLSGLSHVEGAWLLLNSDVHEIQILSQKTPEASSFVKESAAWQRGDRHLMGGWAPHLLAL